MLFCLDACEKRRSEAIVIGKEYIAPAIDPAAPSASPAKNLKAVSRAAGDDEITVDSYVMMRSVRGTGLDPRALKDAQYLMKVRTNADGRTFNVLTDPPHFAKIKLGDPVLVKYRVGKYTGTVWAAEIVD
jgi:hypothetical protein